MQILIPIVLNTLATLCFYFLDKKTVFAKLNKWNKQLLIGVVFGAVSVLASELGWEIQGATMNVRDSAPLSAGLIFGWQAGIIAGVIGGGYRALSVLWGAGTYTALACSISTVVAGILAAILRKYMFDDKKPTFAYAFGITVVMEIFHMLMIFLTNLLDASTAFTFVKACTIPMASLNAVTVGVSVLIVTIMSKEKTVRGRQKEKIAQTFQRWLIINILIAFVVTNLFAFNLQTGIRERQVQETFITTMEDVIEDYEDFIKNYDGTPTREEKHEQIKTITKNRRVGVHGFVAVCDDELKLITEDKFNGQSIEKIGIIPNENMLSKRNSQVISTATIVNQDAEYSEEYLYVFAFREDYCIIAAMPQADAMLVRDVAVYLSTFMQVLAFAALFIMLYFLIKKVVINNIQRINKTLSKISNGKLDEVVNVRSNVEFASLSDDINTTVETLKRYIKEAEERIDKELEYAKQIQNSALPSVFPNKKEYEIYAQMIAAKEVGGDFYDFYQLNENTVAFLVADVSGKGIPAAMFMMTAKTIIKDLAESGLSVGEILTKANERLCENNESGMFVTAWMGIMNFSTGKLTFANAGHNPPLIYRNGNFEYLKSRAGFVLGGMEDVKYKMNELQLQKGDKIFLYTDGVTEATNVDVELYGESRLLEFMNANSNLSPKEFLSSLKNNIDEFVGDAPQFDDITMLFLDYKKGENNKIMQEKMFEAKTERLQDVLDFLNTTLEEQNCSPKLSTALSVAIEEVFVNVAHYAYGDASGVIRFRTEFDKESRELTMEIADKGTPFNPLAKEDPDITLSLDEREIGGLGIFIVKKTMDKISYRFENGENVLTMIKKI